MSQGRRNLEAGQGAVLLLRDHVTVSKLVLLTTRQASKSRYELLG